MNRIVNMLGVYEIRWSTNGDFVSDAHRIRHAGGEKKERDSG